MTGLSDHGEEEGKRPVRSGSAPVVEVKVEVPKTEVLALHSVQCVDEQPGIPLQQVGHLPAASPREIPPKGGPTASGIDPEAMGS